MNFKNEVINDLEKYPLQKTGIENLKQRITTINGNDAESVTERFKLQQALKYAEDICGCVERGLEAIPQEERSLIVDFYVLRQKRYDLQEKYAIEHSQFYKMINKALRHLALAMYGQE